MEGSPRSRKGADTTCPSCGAPAEHDQLVCLECGARLALDYRRPSGWKLPLAVVSAVVLLAAGAFALALANVSDDADSEVADTPATSDGDGTRRGDGTEERERDRGARTDESRTDERRPEERQPARRERRPRRSDPSARTWPADQDGFTVVLVSTEDRASAQQFARTARQGGTSVGVLRSDDYPSLEQGFWIVFSGVYRSRAEAQRAADRLGRGFPGAFPQFVNGTRARR